MRDEGVKLLCELFRNSESYIEADSPCTHPGDEILDQSDSGIPGKLYLPSTDLIHIDLGENELTHKSAKYLSRYLPSNQTLIRLNLGNIDSNLKNRIGPKGAKFIKEILIKNKFIQYLNLEGNILGD